MEAGKSNIFWGLIVKPSKRYETTVQEAFRITKACIEPASAKGDVSSVFVECDNQEEFIVANLQSKTLNESLDLTFGVGEKICFKVEGPGTVHLTGYLMEDDAPPDDFYMDGSDMEGSGESEDEDIQTKIKEDLKRKTTTLDDGKKKKPKLEKESKPEKIAKAKSPGDDSSDGDDSSEDSSDPAETTVDTTLGDLDDTENFAEEEDSDSDDSDDSDEEADSSGAGIAFGDAVMESDDDSSDVEDAPPPKKESPKKKEKTPSKAKANGDVKPAVEVKTPTVVAAKTPDVTKSEKKKKEKTNALETPKKTSVVNGEGDGPKSEKKKKNKEAVSTPNVNPEVLKTPKQEKNEKEVKTPKQAKTPKEEVKTPATNGTPAINGKTPKSVATPGKTPKKTLKGGIQIDDSVVGSGAEVTPGSNVGMYYSGKLKNNKQFDSCTSGKPFKFRIGKGEVIKGWDIGIMGMKVGGKRTLLIPPQMGYGASGAPPDIPGNASLIFEVECKFVK